MARRSPGNRAASSGRTVFSTARLLLGLLDRRQRYRFGRLAALGGTNAVFEALGAALLYTLVGTLVEGGGEGGTVGNRLRGFLPPMSDRGFVYLMCAVTGCFFLLKNASSALEIWRRNLWVNREAASTSSRLLSSYLGMPITFHHETSSAEMTRTSMWAIDQTYRLSLNAVASLASETMVALTLFAVLLVAAPILTPLLIVGLGLTVVTLFRTFRARIHSWGAENQELVAESYRALNEALGGIRDVKLLGRETYFLGRFSRARARSMQLNARVDTLSQSSRLVLELLFVVAMIGAVVVLTVRNVSPAQATSLLAVFAYAGFRLMPSANRVLQALGQLQNSAAAIDVIAGDVARALAQADARRDSAIATVVPLRDRIVADDVTVSFPRTRRPALASVSLVIERGQSVGVVGPSGSGKSTLVDVLSGLLTPDTGRVTVDGVDVHADPAAWSRNIGYVSQATFLLDATLRENIAFGVEASEIDGDAVLQAVELAQLGPFVASLPAGLDSRVGELGVRLSGGQRQRVAIARALYRHPSVLIFDEATSALDTQTEAEITAAIERLAGERTLVIVAHRLTTVARCDTIVCLDDGRVVGTGSFAELAERNAMFRRLVAGSTP